MQINKKRSVATSSVADEDVQSKKFLTTYASHGSMTSIEKTLLHYTIILVV